MLGHRWIISRYSCTWERVSINGEYSGKIFNTDLSAVSATYIHRHLRGLGSRVAISTAYCGEDAPGRAFSLLAVPGRSVSFDVSSWVGSGYSSGLLTSIARIVSLSHRNIGKSTHVLSGHSLYHCPKMLLRSALSTATNKEYAGCPPWTVYDSEAPRAVFLSTWVFSYGFLSSIHLRLMRFASSFGILTSAHPLASVDSNHLVIIDVVSIWMIRWATYGWACSSPVRMACILLYTAELNTSIPWYSMTVSFLGLSGAPENSHIVW